MYESAPLRTRPARPIGPRGIERILPATTVLGLFEEYAAEAPGAPALTCGDERLTYAGLDAAAERIAARLRARGVVRGTRVALCLPRSADLVAGLLAVWKTGGVHLPVDPALPADRIAFVLADAGAELVLTTRGLKDRYADGAALLLVDDPEVGLDAEARADADARLEADARSEAQPGAPAGAPGVPPAQAAGPLDPAYLIYTSGSTGRPKGVLVGHRSLLNVVLELAEEMPCGPGDRWLAVAGAGFDIAMAELTVPLATGAELVLAADAQLRDPRALVGLVRDRAITRMQAVPSQWRLLLDAGFDAPGMVAMTGGEALTVGLAGELRARVGALINAYGPTETTVLSTLWRVPAAPETISIGGPVANTRLTLVDDALEPVAPGVTGELCIAGTGVALGYTGRPELTAERFVPEPGGPAGALMYRTGDRCRLRPDGLLEFVGRTDGQVKIRGHRVEPGEVEARLGAMPGLAGAVVTVYDGGTGGPSLAAYVVPLADTPAPTAAEVRDFARAALTSSMVPSAVVVLDGFPLTANGKVDRRALPDPSAPAPAPAPPASAAAPAAAPVAASAAASGPSDALLDEVCGICREVLGVAQVLPGDDLADLGGHSLSMMQIAGVMSARWGVEVPVELFFEYDTVAEVAEAIRLLRSGARAAAV